MPRKKFLLVLLSFFSCVIVSLLFLFYTGFRLNLSGSLPHLVYRIKPVSSGDCFKAGDFVVLEYTEIDSEAIQQGLERKYLTEHPMMKQIGAVSGDTVLLENDHLYINGMDRGRLAVLSADRQGRPMSIYHTPITLQAGQYWLISHPERGFDSRYFGPIDARTITHTARPIF